MGADVELLEGPLGLGGRDVEGIVAGKAEALHAGAEAGHEAEVFAENLAQLVGLSGGDVA